MAFTPEKKQQVLDLYLRDNPTTRIEQLTGVNRKTIYRWAEDGELTGGKPWGRVKREEEEYRITQQRIKELEAVAKGERTWLEMVKDDLREVVYEEVVNKFRSGQFDAKVGDLAEIVKLYNLLENGAAEKMAFAQWFARKMLELAMEIMDVQQVELFKTRAELLQQETYAKLNPLSVAGTLPLEASGRSVRVGSQNNR